MIDGESTLADNRQKKRVIIVAMSGNTLINFAGPSDVFTHADKYLAKSGSRRGYDASVVSPKRDKKIISPAGFEITTQYCAMEIEMPVDTLIVAGNDFSNHKKPEYQEFFEWLATVNQNNARRIGSVCGGAFALAKAGILNGKKATTHWDLSAKLSREYPLVEVNSNPFYTNDGNIYTSGGVSSGIDLALALVEEDHGKDIALQVARKLVFYLSRPGFQIQFASLLPVCESTSIAEKLNPWFAEHLSQSLDVVTMANHLNMSPRNFTRVFHKQTGLPPAKFIEKLRVETARKYLEDTDLSLEAIAEKCGLGGLVSMRRTFLRHLMVTPSHYRQTFRSALKPPRIEQELQYI